MGPVEINLATQQQKQEDIVRARCGALISAASGCNKSVSVARRDKYAAYCGNRGSNAKRGAGDRLLGGPHKVEAKRQIKAAYTH